MKASIDGTGKVISVLAIVQGFRVRLILSNNYTKKEHVTRKILLKNKVEKGSLGRDFIRVGSDFIGLIHSLAHVQGRKRRQENFLVDVFSDRTVIRGREDFRSLWEKDGEKGSIICAVVSWDIWVTESLTVCEAFLGPVSDRMKTERGEV